MTPSPFSFLFENSDLMLIHELWIQKLHRNILKHLTYLPPLLCDDHLCLVSVKLQPQGPVAQIHLRFPRNQSSLRRGELVKSPSLVSVSILLRVRVASRWVTLRRSIGQKAVVSSISYDRVMGHVAAGTSNRKSRVRWSMLARIREHGTGSC